jgi:hypothetical protein
VKLPVDACTVTLLDSSHRLRGADVKPFGEVLDDAAVPTARHHVLVLGVSAVEGRSERRKVNFVGVLSLVHLEQCAQRGAHVRVERGEQLGHRLIEVEASLELAAIGAAQHEPRHRAGERGAGLDVGKDGVDPVEHRRAERDPGRGRGHAFDPESVDERKHR